MNFRTLPYKVVFILTVWYGQLLLNLMHTLLADTARNTSSVTPLGRQASLAEGHSTIWLALHISTFMNHLKRAHSPNRLE